MLAAPSGALHVVASSSEAMRTLELLQLQADEGPCVDCFATGPARREPGTEMLSTGAGRTSPPGRSKAGFTQSTPCRCAFGAAPSAPSICSGSTRAPSTRPTSSAAQALADVATIAILQHQSAMNAQSLNHQLNQALNSRIIIEQAKGKISQSAGLDIEDAFRRLRSHARSHNLRLSDLTADVADGTINPRSLDTFRPPHRK